MHLENCYWHVGDRLHSFDLDTLQKNLGQKLSLPNGVTPVLCKKGFHGSLHLLDALSYNSGSTIELRYMPVIADSEPDKVVAPAMQIVGLLEDASDILHSFSTELLYLGWASIQESIPSKYWEFLVFCISLLTEKRYVWEIDAYKRRLNMIRTELPDNANARDLFYILDTFLNTFRYYEYLRPATIVMFYHSAISNGDFPNYYKEYLRQNERLESLIRPQMKMFTGEWDVI